MRAKALGRVLYLFGGVGEGGVDEEDDTRGLCAPNRRKQQHTACMSASCDSPRNLGGRVPWEGGRGKEETYVHQRSEGGSDELDVAWRVEQVVADHKVERALGCDCLDVRVRAPLQLHH